MPTREDAPGRTTNAIASAAPRNGAVDAARLFFAFGVVVIHLGPSEAGSGGLLARFFLTSSVQFFFLTSLYFFIERAARLEELRWSSLHFDRLLVPYATWTVLYTLFRWAKCHFLHTPFDLEFARIALYGAGAIHLYYLPLLFLWQALALVVLLNFRTPPHRTVAVAILAAAALFAYVGKVRGYYCFEDAFPTGCLYVALAFLLRFAQSSTLLRRVNVIVAALIAVGIVVVTLRSPFRPWLGPLAAYSAAALALSSPLQISSRALRYACGCSYAIYLAHLAFVELLKVGSGVTFASAVETALAATLICALCIALAALARLHPLPRYLLLGERRSASVPSRPLATVAPA